MNNFKKVQRLINRLKDEYLVYVQIHLEGGRTKLTGGKGRVYMEVWCIEDTHTVPDDLHDIVQKLEEMITFKEQERGAQEVEDESA